MSHFWICSGHRGGRLPLGHVTLRVGRGLESVGKTKIQGSRRHGGGSETGAHWVPPVWVGVQRLRGEAAWTPGDCSWLLVREPRRQKEGSPRRLHSRRLSTPSLRPGASRAPGRGHRSGQHVRRVRSECGRWSRRRNVFLSAP